MVTFSLVITRLALEVADAGALVLLFSMMTLQGTNRPVQRHDDTVGGTFRVFGFVFTSPSSLHTSSMRTGPPLPPGVIIGFLGLRHAAPPPASQIR